MQLALPQLVLSAFQPQELDPVLDSLEDTSPDTLALARYQQGTAGVYPWDYSEMVKRSELLRRMEEGDPSLGPLAERWEKIANAQDRARGTEKGLRRTRVP